MGAYKIKRYVTVIWAGGFALLSLLSLYLFILKRSYVPAITAVGFLGLAILFRLGLSKAVIMTTDASIKRSVLGKLSQEYKWIWIYDMRTVRSTTTGDYVTTLSWATEPQYRGTGGLFSSSRKDAKSGTFLVTSHVAEYSKLLKEIREKAPHADIDALTQKIISDGMHT